MTLQYAFQRLEVIEYSTSELYDGIGVLCKRINAVVKAGAQEKGNLESNNNKLNRRGHKDCAKLILVQEEGTTTIYRMKNELKRILDLWKVSFGKTSIYEHIEICAASLISYQV